MQDDRKRMNRCKAIVATPGRLLHLFENNIIRKEFIKLLVLDEADKLMQMGFRYDIQRLLKLIEGDKQMIASSATYANDLDRLLISYMNHPVAVTPKREAPILLGVKLLAYEIDDEPSEENAQTAPAIRAMQAKVKAIQTIFANVSFKQCIVFSNSQLRAESYCNYLIKSGWQADVISGSQVQERRLEIFGKFKTFQTRILTATDLMARGIDVENVNLVINLDVPNDGSTYLHRVGRCGRFGSRGLAITLLSSESEMMKFRKLLGQIGGEKMTVLKFPKGANAIDSLLWDFSQREKERDMFGEISGFVHAEEAEMVVDDVEITVNENLPEVDGITQEENGGSTSKELSVIEHNQVLLELTKLMVSSPKEENVQVDFNIFEEYKKYKQNLATESIDVEQPAHSGESFGKNKELLKQVESLLMDAPRTQNLHLNVNIFEEYARTQRRLNEPGITERLSKATDQNENVDKVFLKALKNLEIKTEETAQVASTPRLNEIEDSESDSRWSTESNMQSTSAQSSNSGSSSLSSSNYESNTHSAVDSRPAKTTRSLRAQQHHRTVEQAIQHHQDQYSRWSELYWGQVNQIKQYVLHAKMHRPTKQ